MINIHLSPSQKEHVAKIKDILLYSYFALDVSMSGKGRRYTASVLSEELSLNIVSIDFRKMKWNNMRKFYNISILHNVNFRELLQLDIKQLVNMGSLFVIHGIERKKLDLNHPCLLLTKCIQEAYKKGNKSRILFISESYFEKEVHVLNFFKAINALTEKDLSCKDWNPFSGKRLIHPGMQQIFDFCTDVIISKQYLHYKIQEGFICNDKDAKKRAYKLFYDIILVAFSASMK